MVYGIWYLNVTDNRELALSVFVKNFLNDESVSLEPLNGDASLRRYFRIAKHNLIAVDSPPDSQKNKEFVAINKALANVLVKVPAIKAIDFDRGFMVLEDLGNVTFSMVAVGDKRSAYYQKALGELLKLPLIPNDVALPLFDEAFMQTEVSLFEIWMLEKKLQVVLTAKERQQLHEAYRYLFLSIRNMPYIAMHRDFHSRNLMVMKDDTVAVIDFQDMVRGPFTYDLASLLYDCYVNLEEKLIESLLLEAYRAYGRQGLIRDLDYKDFVKLVHMVSLQRHIKVLGIFIRLSLRDGKHGYLLDLPRVIDYTLKECQCDPHFAIISEIIKKYVKGNF